ncbi:hypothetical protein GC176_06665 [bacterium]|nr:hypothetical protein [bacterium]
MIAPHIFEPSSGDTATGPLHDNPPSRISSTDEPATLSVWSRWVRSVVSIILVLHLLAIVSAPWAMAPSSVLAQRVFSFFQPYVDLAFLNHGYHFFAPEPGPSHIIRYELQLDDGRQVTGKFPDPQQHSPRLLYHRHFMLSETANRLAVDPAQQAALDELTRSFAKHLMTQYSASRATLFLRRHYIPTPEQVASGLPLDAPELFAERPLGTFDRNSLYTSGEKRVAFGQQGAVR